MPFRIALSGLNAASSDLGVTANNIANTATVGFKGSRAEFGDVYAVAYQGISDTATGSGVRLSNVSQQFGQGNIDFTDNSLDMAISGEGFFVLSDEGSLNYSRAGTFSVDREGYVVNAQNMRVQVYPPNSTGQINTGVLTDLRLDTTEGAPSPTTSIEVGANLPADDSAPPTPVFDPNDATSFNGSTSTTVYDSLGTAMTGTLYFVKDGTTANTWDAYFYIDGTAIGGAQQLVFNPDGTLNTPANGDINFGTFTPTNGAAPLSPTVNYSNATQYGGGFGVNQLMQDGFASGRLSGIDVDPSGVVLARFTNGQSQPLGQIALANFPNPQGLQQQGNTSWAETFSSGTAVLGQAGTGSLGLIQSGALEGSNVDLTEQLVNLITAQRNFQANAQVISTADSVTQTIINIR
ncbi:MAG: flagellar hook protein FlgE [Pseudomonadota bacterium]|nr:flagellar hook protein FlgE [Pseudomonadota bacterium]